QQLARGDVVALLYRQGVDNAIEGGADVGLAQDILGGIVGRLRLALLGFYFGDFRRGVTSFPFLFQQVQVGQRRVVFGFGGAYFASRGSTVFLQAFEGVQVPLGIIAIRLIVVATGEWASKFWMGSIFPLVEIRLRMRPRTTPAARTGMISPRMELKAANKTTAATMAAAMIHHRLRAKKLEYSRCKVVL